MNAIKYFNEKKRMTKVKQSGYCGINCSECPLHNGNNGTNYSCHQFERLQPENAIEIVENWAQEHPVKTYAEDFFEKFPDAPKTSSGTPKALRCGVYGNMKCKHGICADCWNEPIEE